MPLKTISLRMDEEDYKTIDEMARKLGVSKSWLIRRFVKLGLMGWKKDPVLMKLIKAPFLNNEENEELTRFLESYDSEDWNVVHREEI